MHAFVIFNSKICNFIEIQQLLSCKMHSSSIGNAELFINGEARGRDTDVFRI